MQAVCSCKVDLAKYAGFEDKDYRVQMQFESKGENFANVSVTISSRCCSSVTRAHILAARSVLIVRKACFLWDRNA